MITQLASKEGKQGALLEAMSLYKQVLETFEGLSSNSNERRLFHRFVIADLCDLDWIFSKIDELKSMGAIEKPEKGLNWDELKAYRDAVELLQQDYERYIPLAAHFGWNAKKELLEKVQTGDCEGLVELWAQLVEEVGRLWHCFNHRIKTCSYAVAAMVVSNSQTEGYQLLLEAAKAIEGFLELDLNKKAFYEKYCQDNFSRLNVYPESAFAS